jgi:hypothetical protein
LSELSANKDLIDKGNDDNSSTGSDDCPSEDNFSKAVLRQILPISKKDKTLANMKAKEQLRLIFGFSRKKELVEKAKKEKPKEEKKQPPQKIEKRVLRKIISTPKTNEESKVKPEEPPVPTIAYVDATTQTERIDFQKARTKWIMAKFGKSRTQYKKSTSTLI